MSVPVMDVGVMRVRMNQWLMPMWVAVRLSERVRRGVGVLVMVVMRVQMLMLHGFVVMLVVVTVGEIQPQAQRHKNGGDSEADGDFVAQKQNRDGRANKRSD